MAETRRLLTEPPCRRCKGLGLIRVRYKSGESDDIAMCRCGAGQWYQRGGAELVRHRCPWIPEGAQIGTLAEFEALEPVKGEVFNGG